MPRSVRHAWLKRLAIALVALLAVCAIAFYAYTSDYYRAHPSALTQPTAYAVEDEGDAIEFIPADAAHATMGIVFYPGAKVDPHAYEGLAGELAKRGYYCAIVKMPFNLAFFGIDAAADIMADNPNVQSWWIAGHSLGGAMAAEFAANNADDLQGIVFLASYAAADLSNTDLEALSLYGSEDLVLNREKYEENAANLPVRFAETVIEGGNHAGFGDYGPQDGDGSASISADKQQEIAADTIDAAIRAR